jgi:predicted DCC family thiol-disulfide oxidoreductase YuxK
MSELTGNWKIRLLYDGECPLCVREVNFLKARDGGRELIDFVDIAAEDYNLENNGGIDFERAMGRIHAIKADGEIIENLEVFRQVYEVLGMGWVYAITKLPILGAIADFLYGIWADWRLPLTGRPNLKTVIEQRQQKILCNSSDRCRV